MPACVLSALSWVLILALFAQAAVPGSVSSSPSPSVPSSVPTAGPAFSLDLGGPTVPEFRAAFSGRPARKVDAVTFNRYVSLHSRHGRLLTGPALASAVAMGRVGRGAKATVINGRNPHSNPYAHCDSLRSKAAKACRDSLRAHAKAKVDSISVEYGLEPGDSLVAKEILANQEKPRLAKEPSSRVFSFKDSAAARNSLLPDSGRERHRQDTLVPGERPERKAQADKTDYEDDRSRGWFLNFYADLTDWDGDGGGGGGDGGMDAGDWATVIYLVVGLVVVGAFVLYGAHTLFELATNKEEYPLFMKTGARFSYSGRALHDPMGNADLYRDAYLAGLRFAIGFDRPGMGLGLATEGGYIVVKLHGISDPSQSFAFQGGYLVAGPMLRFGRNEPLSFSLEFLNGTSTHESIGWISKSRMAVTGRVGNRTLLGAHLGAVFYDLEFLDGLGWRNGNFNRDLSLIYGLDIGLEL